MYGVVKGLTAVAHHSVVVLPLTANDELQRPLAVAGEGCKGVERRGGGVDSGRVRGVLYALLFLPPDVCARGAFRRGASFSVPREVAIGALCGLANLHSLIEVKKVS
jgi:hypothetical protein